MPFCFPAPRSCAADASPATAGRPADTLSQPAWAAGPDPVSATPTHTDSLLTPSRQGGWARLDVAGASLTGARHPLPSTVRPEGTQDGLRQPLHAPSLPLNYHSVQRAPGHTAGYNSRLPRVRVSPLPGHDKLSPRKTLDFTSERGMRVVSRPLHRCGSRATKGRSG